MIETTWTAYSKVWQEWLEMLRLAGVEQGDLEVRLVVLYFVSRNMEQGVSVSALERKLAGLAFFFKLHGWVDFTKDFWVRQAVKDIGSHISAGMLGGSCPLVIYRPFLWGWTRYVHPNTRLPYSRRLFPWHFWGISD